MSVKTLFFYEEFLKEVELKKGTVDTEELRSQRRYAVQKYADAILRAKSVLRPNSTLVILCYAQLNFTIHILAFNFIKLSNTRNYW